MSDLKGVSVIPVLPKLRGCFLDLYQDLRGLYRSLLPRARLRHSVAYGQWKALGHLTGALESPFSPHSACPV
jgi:hypothetical protein